ncbi:hypothetical protein Nepgr_015924 [Nepenthes gracilis]|uniref:Uncharacterized protein n=1 Tax=Nepenthes gracilis TaxID=150966 RepID=A0AAD3XR56_NEPGR|nr:hypothetical protein Nepgr_015924 [Nepenthes gracilis]
MSGSAPSSSSPSPDGSVSLGFYEASGGMGPCTRTHSGFPSFPAPCLPFVAEVTSSGLLVAKSCVPFLNGESLSTIPVIPWPLSSANSSATTGFAATSVLSPYFLKQIANVDSSYAPFPNGALDVNSIPGHAEGEDLSLEGHLSPSSLIFEDLPAATLSSWSDIV